MTPLHWAVLKVSETALAYARVMLADSRVDVNITNNVRF